MLVNKDPFPITAKSALGSKIWDVNGNEYTDYLMMAGPISLGHNYPPLIENVTRVIREEGVGTDWTSEWEIKAETLRGGRDSYSEPATFRFLRIFAQASG
jgi:glutamate-1-semialdehyde aminotransferase